MLFGIYKRPIVAIRVKIIILDGNINIKYLKKIRYLTLLIVLQLYYRRKFNNIEYIKKQECIEYKNLCLPDSQWLLHLSFCLQ